MPRKPETWSSSDIEDTRLETELGAKFTRLPPGKPERTISAKGTTTRVPKTHVFVKPKGWG